MPRLRAALLAIVVLDAIGSVGACSTFDDAPAKSPDAGDDASTVTATDAAEAATEADAGPGADAGPDASIAASYRAAVLADAPLAYWRMGATTLGTIVPDETTNKNDLLLKGAPDYELDAGGIFDGDRAIWFGGQTANAVPTDSAPFQFNDKAPFTIEMWARRELTDAGTAGQTFQSIASFVHGYTTPLPSTQSGYMLFLRTDAIEGTFADYGALDGGPIEVKGRFVAPGVWAHYALVMDGTNATLYVDGEQQQQLPVKGAFTTRSEQLTIAKQSNDVRYFRGFLDEIAIYPTALSPQRLAKHYTIVRP